MEFISGSLPAVFPPPAEPVSAELLTLGRGLAGGAELSAADAGAAIRIMMGGACAEYEAALFLSALEPEACSPEALAAMAGAMLERAVRVELPHPYPVLGDDCGTGGDNLHLFNVSTAAMFIMAAAGAPIAKHGNRASTSRCGSADVLEASGARIDLGPEGVSRCIESCGVGFMFAPLYHPAMKNVAAVRRKLPFRTVFNILGPLCNPAPVTFQLMGIYHPDALETAGTALALMGRRRALLVCGETGMPDSWMDEVSLSGVTRAVLVENGNVRRMEFTPDDLGLESCPLAELGGGEPFENASLLRDVLERTAKGPLRRTCLANASAGLYAGGLATTLAEGTEMARTALDTGRALNKLEEFISETKR